MRTALRRWLPWALALVLLLVAADALARVGGGQDFSRRPSGGGGGSGGDGIPIELVFLLVQLVIEYPAIGLPLLLVVIAVVVVRAMFFSGWKRPANKMIVGKVEFRR